MVRHETGPNLRSYKGPITHQQLPPATTVSRRCHRAMERDSPGGAGNSMRTPSPDATSCPLTCS